MAWIEDDPSPNPLQTMVVLREIVWDSAAVSIEQAYIGSIPPPPYFPQGHFAHLDLVQIKEDRATFLPAMPAAGAGSPMILM